VAVGIAFPLSFLIGCRGSSGFARCDLHEHVPTRSRELRKAGAAPTAAPIASEFCTGFGSCSSNAQVSPQPKTSAEAPVDEDASATIGGEDSPQQQSQDKTDSLIGFGRFGVE